jgi:hypothetical protein
MVSASLSLTVAATGSEFGIEKASVFPSYPKEKRSTALAAAGEKRRIQKSATNFPRARGFTASLVKSSKFKGGSFIVQRKMLLLSGFAPFDIRLGLYRSPYEKMNGTNDSVIASAFAASRFAIIEKSVSQNFFPSNSRGLLILGLNNSLFSV